MGTFLVDWSQTLMLTVEALNKIVYNYIFIFLIFFLHIFIKINVNVLLLVVSVAGQILQLLYKFPGITCFGKLETKKLEFPLCYHCCELFIMRRIAEAATGVEEDAQRSVLRVNEQKKDGCGTVGSAWALGAVKTHLYHRKLRSVICLILSLPIFIVCTVRNSIMARYYLCENHLLEC